MSRKIEKAVKRIEELEQTVKPKNERPIYKAVWGDETTEPDSAFISAWREPEEVLKSGQNN